MRIIAVKTLKSYMKKYPKSEQSLLAWYDECLGAEWNNPNQLKAQYGNASILNDKRVVFNIHGNTYRLLVNIEYRLKIVFIIWFGTHKEYDKINAEKIEHVKTD